MQCVAPWKGKIKLMDSFEDAWKVISDYCKSKITDIAYNTWISRIQPVDLDFDNGTAYLLVPNDFHAQTLRRCYMSLLNEGFEEIFGTKFNIEFRTPANAPKKSKPSAAASITTSAATAPLLQSPDSSSYEYTFDTFIVGASNKFAHAACLAVFFLMANLTFHQNIGFEIGKWGFADQAFFIHNFLRTIPIFLFDK